MIASVWSLPPKIHPFIAVVLSLSSRQVARLCGSSIPQIAAAEQQTFDNSWHCPMPNNQCQPNRWEDEEFSLGWKWNPWPDKFLVHFQRTKRHSFNSCFISAIHLSFYVAPLDKYASHCHSLLLHPSVILKGTGAWKLVFTCFQLNSSDNLVTL